MRLFYRHRPRTLIKGSKATCGFTLLEVLVTLAIIVIIVVVLLQFITDISGTVKTTATDPFAEASSGFETVTRNLAAATLEPYQDYADTTGVFRTASSTGFVPDHPARRSDLDFICGLSTGTNGILAASGRITSGSGVFFLAPQGYTQTDAHEGLERLLNGMGYFVEFGDDSNAPSFLLPNAQRWRWRLKQVRQPSESLQVYALPTSSAWIGQLAPPATPTPTLAENVIALIILPERTHDDFLLSPTFSYDSRDAGNALTRHQLPPILRVILVAIDETSAEILASQDGTNPPALVPAGLFQQAAQLDADLATLDQSLTTQKIGHRIFQREIQVESAAWTTAPSQ